MKRFGTIDSRANALLEGVARYETGIWRKQKIAIGLSFSRVVFFASSKMGAWVPCKHFRQASVLGEFLDKRTGFSQLCFIQAVKALRHSRDVVKATSIC